MPMKPMMVLWACFGGFKSRIKHPFPFFLKCWLGTHWFDPKTFEISCAYENPAVTSTEKACNGISRAETQNSIQYFYTTCYTKVRIILILQHSSLPRRPHAEAPTEDCFLWRSSCALLSQKGFGQKHIKICENLRQKYGTNICHNSGWIEVRIFWSDLPMPNFYFCFWSVPTNGTDDRKGLSR